MLSKLFINGFYSLVGDASLAELTTFVDARKLRRAEQISKNALLCACKALSQAKNEALSLQDFGISLAMGAGALESTFKFMDSILENGDELSSPTAFASSVHNSTALFLSMSLGIHGPCVVTGQLDASFGAALLTAQQFLAKNMCKQVLVVVTEDTNSLLTDIVAKHENVLGSLIYQSKLTPTRVAGAFVVSGEPTSTTQFILEKISLTNSADLNKKSEPLLPIRSCAHSVLWLAHYLTEKKAFSFKEQFAGSILEIAGNPYVLS